jgi:hypothetical protein
LVMVQSEPDSLTIRLTPDRTAASITRPCVSAHAN